MQWTVGFPGNDGGRPVNAIGMFVRLLSRTGAPSTIGFDSASVQEDDSYVASVTVPEGGIGGIRMGRRGSTGVFFPLDNDPFTSPGGARCDVAAFRATIAAFVRAYNEGDFRRLDSLFSRERFVWYWATGPSRSLRRGKHIWETLISYFRARHRHGDRLELRSYRFNGYDRLRDLGHFQYGARRRAEDYHEGRWFDSGGKGALDCSKPPVTIAVMVVGGPVR